MTRAKGDAGLDGFLNLCKARGPTSHDLVAAVRRTFGTRRVGHAGTLDPLAEGVLPMALGRATRLLDRLAEADKEYYAEVRLGRTTTTDDAEGAVLQEREVPRFTQSDLDSALAEFVGEIDQVPPAFSALKIDGQRAYALARAGREPTLASRRVTIHRIERRSWSRPVLGIGVRCSKGTYVRALARDLGERLGVGASLERLVRTRVGPFELSAALGAGDLAAGPSEALLPADILHLDEPALTLDERELEHLRHGRSWPARAGTAPLARAYTQDGRFAGLLAAADGHWRPKLVLVEAG